MPLIVKGHRLLVKPDAPKDSYNKDVPEELKKLDFKIAMDSDQEKREEVAASIGTVVQVGNTCWSAFDRKSDGWEPWCKVGDRITFSRYGGKLQQDPVTKEKFMVINDEDVHCIVIGEKAPWEDTDG